MHCFGSGGSASLPSQQYGACSQTTPTVLDRRRVQGQRVENCEALISMPPIEAREAGLVHGGRGAYATAWHTCYGLECVEHVGGGIGVAFASSWNASYLRRGYLAGFGLVILHASIPGAYDSYIYR